MFHAHAQVLGKLAAETAPPEPQLQIPAGILVLIEVLGVLIGTLAAILPPRHATPPIWTRCRH